MYPFRDTLIFIILGLISLMLVIHIALDAWDYEQDRIEGTVNY